MNGAGWHMRCTGRADVSFSLARVGDACLSVAKVTLQPDASLSSARENEDVDGQRGGMFVLHTQVRRAWPRPATPICRARPETDGAEDERRRWLGMMHLAA